LEAHNGTPRTVCVELGGNAAEGDNGGASVELSGTRLIYDTTNDFPAYALDWQDCSNCTATQYGYFVNTEDVYGGTVLSVGTLPIPSAANYAVPASNETITAPGSSDARKLKTISKEQALPFRSTNGKASISRASPLTDSSSEIVTLKDAEMIQVDAGRGCTFQVTLRGNRTLGNPTNLKDGQSLKFFFTQDAVGGRTLKLGSSYCLSPSMPGIELSKTGSRVDVMTTTFLAHYGSGTNLVLGFVKGF